MEWFTTHSVEIINAIAYIVTGASIIVKLTPTTLDDAIIGKVMTVLRWLSLNK